MLVRHLTTVVQVLVSDSSYSNLSLELIIELLVILLQHEEGDGSSAYKRCTSDVVSGIARLLCYDALAGKAHVRMIDSPLDHWTFEAVGPVLNCGDQSFLDSLDVVSELSLSLETCFLEEFHDFVVMAHLHLLKLVAFVR